MNLFRKKKKRAVEKGLDELPALCKEFEVLNRTPTDYKYESWYVEFLDSAEGLFRKALRRTATDDLSGDMLDAYIDSVTKRMKSASQVQYNYHMSIIGHHKGILEGDIALAKGHLKNLQQDKVELEQNLDFYRNIRKEGNHR